MLALNSCGFLASLFCRIIVGIITDRAMVARDLAAEERKPSHDIVGSGGYGTLCTDKSFLDCCTSPNKALVLHAHLPRLHQPHKAGTRRRSDNQHRQVQSCCVSSGVAAISWRL